jgi:hypothetical protein
MRLRFALIRSVAQLVVSQCIRHSQLPWPWFRSGFVDFIRRVTTSLRESILFNVSLCNNSVSLNSYSHPDHSFYNLNAAEWNGADHHHCDSSSVETTQPACDGPKPEPSAHEAHLITKRGCFKRVMCHLLCAEGQVLLRAASKRTRLYVCTRQDQLRAVLERLSMPAVRRVIVVHPETSKVEGIISLSDVARFLFL